MNTNTTTTVKDIVAYLAQDVERLIKQSYPEFSLDLFKPKRRGKSDMSDLKSIAIYMLEDWFKIGRVDIARGLEKHYATVIYYANLAIFYTKHNDAQFLAKYNKIIAEVEKQQFIAERKLIIQDYLKQSSRKNKQALAA